MMRYLLVFGMLIMALGCKDVVIRDAKVYGQEIAFIDAASEELVDRGKALIAQTCVCIQPVEDVLIFETSQCDELAETILVVEARMKYHTGFMRYLGGLTEERPPEDPPVVPGNVTLCPDGGDS